MLQLLNLENAVCTWKPERLEQIDDIPVPQTEEEIVEVNQLVPQERIKQHRSAWNSTRNLYFEDVKVFQA